jgi:demethylmenaquinone methyltransferase/2-methoxy-6-polyprenyl-1,4-benzoquinol methylase
MCVALMMRSLPWPVRSAAASGVRRLAFQIGETMSANTPSHVEEITAAGPGSARKREALELFRGLPRHYDLLSAALSFGQDPRWRRALVSAVAPAAGERVLDVATGTGMVAAALIARSDCSVVGVDQSAEMLAAARARFGGGGASGGPAGVARAERGARVELIEGQAEALPFKDASFDALTFTYLLRYVDDPRATVTELARVVRPGGRVASLEFGVPPLAPARWAWRLYTAIGLPTLGRVASAEWAEVGRFLGPSIRTFYERHPVARIVDYWHEAGLRDVVVHQMSLGGGIVMSATKARAGGSPDGAGE